MSGAIDQTKRSPVGGPQAAEQATARPPTGRMKNRLVKHICADVLGYLPRVELGKGTARSWVTIRLSGPITEAQREQITAELLRLQLIGQYPDDMSNDMFPCVSFRNGGRIA